MCGDGNMIGEISPYSILLRNYGFCKRLLKYFPTLNYNDPLVNRDFVKMSYTGGDFDGLANLCGVQQRCFSLYWAVRQCFMTGSVGLDIGSHGMVTPWCIGIDKYMGEHPEYGGLCDPTLKWDAEDLGSFCENKFPLVLANHVAEHMNGNFAELLKEHWVRVLRVGGILALITPDDRLNDVVGMEKGHTQSWNPVSFTTDVVKPTEDILETVEFDTLKNDFSFNWVAMKR